MLREFLTDVLAEQRRIFRQRLAALQEMFLTASPSIEQWDFRNARLTFLFSVLTLPRTFE